MADMPAPDAAAQEEFANPFEALDDAQFAEVAGQLGIELLDAEAPAEGAEEVEAPEGEEVETTDEQEAEGAASSERPMNAALDPAGMAAVAQGCATEAAGYVEKLTQLGEQVGEHDKKTAGAIAKLAKKASGLADDAAKYAEKAAKAASAKKLGDAAEMAQEADAACAEIRALVKQAQELVGGAKLPEEEDPGEAPPPGKSAITAWADSMLG